MALIDELNIKPKPDFERLKKVLFRRGEPDRVPFYELFFDKPMKDHIMGKPCSFHLLLPIANLEQMILNDIEMWHRLGFDYASFMPFILFGDNFQVAEDHAPLKGPLRFWLKESKGAGIAARVDFEKHRWPDPNMVNLDIVDWAIKQLPDGMGAMSQLPGIVETTTWLMGYENFGIASIEDPELIKMVFDKVGSTLMRLTERILEIPGIFAINHGDDMGHKGGTLISPKTMRELGFGWHKKIAEACHAKGIAYILHSCGQVDSIMPDFIDFIGIDAKHSFEDIIEPVESIKRKWGNRIAVLGGIDVDLLSRGTTQDVRNRTREVLKKCAPGGGYCLGSGNSVTNYIKPENYLAMLDEGWKSGVYPIAV